MGVLLCPILLDVLGEIVFRVVGFCQSANIFDPRGEGGEDGSFARYIQIFTCLVEDGFHL